jgi:hypothetical protein
MEVHRSPMHRSIPFPTTPTVPSVGFGFNLIHHASTRASPPRSAPPTPSRQVNSNKRRHEPDAEQEDENMMARSPSPMERPKRALTKRVRVDGPKPSAQAASGKPAAESAESVDVGLLLGMTCLRILECMNRSLTRLISIATARIPPCHPHLFDIKTSWS